MDGSPSLWNFLRLVYAEWASLVTGSFSAVLFLLGLGLSVAAVLGYTVPGGPVVQVATWTLAICSGGRATYLIWAREHNLRMRAEEKLVPKLTAIYDASKKPCRDVVRFTYPKGPPRDAMAYRIEIENTSAETIGNCEGYLTEVAFEGEDSELGTMNLTWSSTTVPFATQIDLRASVKRHLDVVLVYEDGSVAIASPGWPPNNRQDFFSRRGHYRFNVVIGGDGSVSLPPYRLRLNLTGNWQTSTMETATA